MGSITLPMLEEPDRGVDHRAAGQRLVRLSEHWLIAGRTEPQLPQLSE
ncbi:MAG: hypothetical protein CM15mP103_09060 [Gammaproteobacteria bacterium]|nr:MAG: hypothetical protein CM15mP103_09060 [Gammaproteobacteria bacterium]